MKFVLLTGPLLANITGQQSVQASTLFPEPHAGSEGDGWEGGTVYKVWGTVAVGWFLRWLWDVVSSLVIAVCPLNFPVYFSIK